MKCYHIILSLLFIISSCISDETIENRESNSQNLIIEKGTDDLVRAPQNPPEILHLSLQYMSYNTAAIIYENISIQQEVQAFLTKSEDNKISTAAIFSERSPVPLLRDELIDLFEFCGYPERPYHRPGIIDDGGGFSPESIPWICNNSYTESVLYEEVMINNTTELFFPNRLDLLEITPPVSRTIVSTSVPNWSLLRKNEGYRFCSNIVEAEYYFNIEYHKEEVEYEGQNPIRINATNDDYVPNESIVIARIN